ncbi:MAG: BON domain-containing protein [Pyrinomonadaceae bacterium]
MANRSILRIGFMLSMVMIFSLAVSAQATDCSATTDDALVASIMAKIKVKYASQMNHINVRSKDKVVTLEGWVTTKRIKGEIEKIAKNTPCVNKKVNNIMTIGVGGGCGPGTKPCGTICIPEDEKCNITEEGSRPQAPAPIKPKP